jgi:hypothetical protein
MPIWTPEKVWFGQDVYIIGGGKSLEHFDWNLLFDKCTIGCNDAYLLGVDICKICFFDDVPWLKYHENELAKFEGAVFAPHRDAYDNKFNWLWTVKQKSSNIHKECLGWYKSSGAHAVKLAALLGAKRIYLLGFDMKLVDGKNNWHVNHIDKPNPDVFEKFIKGFQSLKESFDEKYPDIEVVNVTDDSDLNIFPKIKVDEFWKGKQNAKV